MSRKIKDIPISPLLENATDNNVGTKHGTNLAEVGTDTISRQAAIDLIESIETERLKGNIELIYAPAIKGLRALPPAQPQIIRCKDCKYREYYRESGHICVLDTGDPYMTGRNAEDDDWFCADAERREVTT